MEGEGGAGSPAEQGALRAALAVHPDLAAWLRLVTKFLMILAPPTGLWSSTHAPPLKVLVSVSVSVSVCVCERKRALSLPLPLVLILPPAPSFSLPPAPSPHPASSSPALAAR